MNVSEAIILAGGNAAPEFGVQYRWQAQYKGKTFLQHVLDALPTGVRPIVVGTDIPEGICCVPPGKLFSDSLRNGMQESKTEHVLVLSADLPFLKTDSIQRFLQLVDPGADLNYSVVQTSFTFAAFPGMARTALKMREGEFTGGNVVLIHRERVVPLLGKLEKFYAARKKPLKLAQEVGLDMMMTVLKLRFASQSVSMVEIENKASKLLGVKIKAVPVECPDLATDIDNSGHLAWLRALENGS